MAYDEDLAARIRAVLDSIEDVTERKMFGGLAFLVGGQMTCGIVGADLMMRLGEEGADAALDEPHTRPMDFTGKPMRSMVYVEPAGIDTDVALQGWIERAITHTRTLPPKRPRAR